MNNWNGDIITESNRVWGLVEVERENVDEMDEMDFVFVVEGGGEDDERRRRRGDCWPFECSSRLPVALEGTVAEVERNGEEDLRSGD